MGVERCGFSAEIVLKIYIVLVVLVVYFFWYMCRVEQTLD